MPRWFEVFEKQEQYSVLSTQEKQRRMNAAYVTTAWTLAASAPFFNRMSLITGDLVAIRSIAASGVGGLKGSSKLSATSAKESA